MNLLASLYGCLQPFQPTPAALPSTLSGWMANPSASAHPSASAGPLGLAPNNAGRLHKTSEPLLLIGFNILTVFDKHSCNLFKNIVYKLKKEVLAIII